MNLSIHICVFYFLFSIQYYLIPDKGVHYDNQPTYLCIITGKEAFTKRIIGIHRNLSRCYQQLEIQGYTNPSSDKIVKISEFLDVDVYYLLTGEYQPASNLQIAEESEYHAFPSDPDEHLLLQLFHKLSPMDKGRIIGQLEQKLAEK